MSAPSIVSIESGRLVIIPKRRLPHGPMTECCALLGVPAGPLTLSACYVPVEGHPGTAALRKVIVGGRPGDSAADATPTPTMANTTTTRICMIRLFIVLS